MSYFVFFSYLHVNCSGSITSVGEGQANLSAIVYLYSCGFCSKRFPLPLGAWDGFRYLILALPEPSIIMIISDPLRAKKIFIRKKEDGPYHSFGY